MNGGNKFVKPSIAIRYKSVFLKYFANWTLSPPQFWGQLVTAYRYKIGSWHIEAYIKRTKYFLDEIAWVVEKKCTFYLFQINSNLFTRVLLAICQHCLRLLGNRGFNPTCTLRPIHNGHHFAYAISSAFFENVWAPGNKRRLNFNERVHALQISCKKISK